MNEGLHLWANIQWRSEVFWNSSWKSFLLSIVLSLFVLLTIDLHSDRVCHMQCIAFRERWIARSKTMKGNNVPTGCVDHWTVTMIWKESHDDSFVLSQGANLWAGSALYHRSWRRVRCIRRRRQAVLMDSENRLSDHLKQTDRGENFVLHEDKDLTIFTTDSNLSVLKTCKHWFADGTFWVTEYHLDCDL